MKTKAFLVIQHFKSSLSSEYAALIFLSHFFSFGTGLSSFLFSRCSRGFFLVFLSASKVGQPRWLFKTQIFQKLWPQGCRMTRCRRNGRNKGMSANRQQGKSNKRSRTEHDDNKDDRERICYHRFRSEKQYAEQGGIFLCSSVLGVISDPGGHGKTRWVSFDVKLRTHRLLTSPILFVEI